MNCILLWIVRIKFVWKGIQSKYWLLFYRCQCYPMFSKPRGHVLIIDNEDFKNDIFPKREGSHVDSKNLDCLFTELGFKVKRYDLSGYCWIGLQSNLVDWIVIDNPKKWIKHEPRNSKDFMALGWNWAMTITNMILWSLNVFVTNTTKNNTYNASQIKTIFKCAKFTLDWKFQLKSYLTRVWDP